MSYEKQCMLSLYSKHHTCEKETLATIALAKLKDMIIISDNCTQKTHRNEKH